MIHHSGLRTISVESSMFLHSRTATFIWTVIASFGSLVKCVSTDRRTREAKDRFYTTALLTDMFLVDRMFWRSKHAHVASILFKLHALLPRMFRLTDALPGANHT